MKAREEVTKVRQQEYDTIVSCIQFGAPALATSLVTTLNKDLENSNNWVQYQKKLSAELAKAEKQQPQPEAE